MRGGALPPALLCAALAFALSFAPSRARWSAVVALVVIATVASLATQVVAWREGVFLGCWVSVVIAAAAVHLPGGVGPRLAITLGINSGLWVGLVIAVAGSRLDLVKALPVVFLCVPGAWLVGSGRKIVLKVVASWLIAVSVLAASLPLVPTPGYQADHME